MNNKKMERLAKVITALLFVVSVTMFVMCFVVQPSIMRSYDEVEVPSVKPVNAVEPEITNLVEVHQKPATKHSEKPVEVVEMVVLEQPIETPVDEKTKDDVEDICEDIEPEVTVNPEDVELLAAVIYQEAGGNKCCDDCRRRVADVVLNRVADERFPDTLHGVLTQERQYGRFHWTGVVWPDKAYADSERPAVERAYRIAEEVLRGEHSELYGQGYIWQAEFMQGTDIVFHCNTYFGKG